MSTRAMYTFRNAEGEEHHVYKHHDGYPSGAAEALARALPFAWQLPRYEPDEFAAAFVAGNKANYIHEELAILRELEALGRAAAFTGEATDPAKIGQLMKDLDYSREMSGKGYNGGGVRLYQSGRFVDIAPYDLEYWYVITQAKDGRLMVTANAVSHQGAIEYVEDRKRPGRYVQRTVPLKRRGWTSKELFVAELGDDLKAAAEAYDNDRRAA